MINPNTTIIDNGTLEQFIICAFRYAVTRRSGVVTEILSRIEPYWNSISDNYQRQIKWDIEYHLEREDITEEDKPMCMEFLKK